MKTLPAISAAFEKGELTYTKVRALTRVATSVNESELLGMALQMTAQHLEEFCCQRRNASGDSTATAKSAYDKRSLYSRRDDARGMLCVSIELPMEEGLLLEQALDKAVMEVGADAGSPSETTGWNAIQADAMVSMAKAYLSGATNQVMEPADSAASSTSAADHYQVVVHVTEQALKGQEGQSELPGAYLVLSAA